MFEVLGALGIVYAWWKFFKESEEEREEKKKKESIVVTKVTKIGAVTPVGQDVPACKWNPAEFQDTMFLVEQIVKIPGSTLMEKILNVDPATGKSPGSAHYIDLVRLKRGSTPIEGRMFRSHDPDQTPRQWVANLAYWGIYAKGPVKIQKGQKNCVDAWLRIFKIVDAGFDSYGL